MLWKSRKGYAPAGRLYSTFQSNLSKNFNFGSPTPLSLHRWGWNLACQITPPSNCCLFPSRLKSQNLPLSQIFRTIDSLPASGLTPRSLYQDRFWASRFFVFFVFFRYTPSIKLAVRQLLGVRKYSETYRIVSFIWSSLPLSEWKGSTALRLNRKNRPRISNEWPKNRPVRWTMLRHSRGLLDDWPKRRPCINTGFIFPH